MRIILTEKQSKFAREVGSVVLGVLIALGIGEIAEAVRWQVRVDRSMAAMRTEVGGNRFNIVERRAYQDCLVNRLTEVGHVLGDARRTGILPHIDNVAGPGLRGTESSAFEVSKSEGVPLHMDRDQARLVALIYASFDAYATIASEERNSWRLLGLLENAPGPVSDDLLTALLQSWAEATAQSKLIGNILQQTDDQLEKLGFAVEYASEVPNRRALTSAAQRQPVCAPLLVNGKPASLR